MSLNYVGSELDVFAHARNWKNYVGKRLAPYLKPDVLEVGAGFGAFTRVLCVGGPGRWVCLEPDEQLLARAKHTLRDEQPQCEFVLGTLETLAPTEVFDAILYMDVLEHIED